MDRRLISMGSIYSEKSKNWQLRLDYTVSQSVTDNKSTLALTLYVYDGSGYSQNENANQAYYVIQGKTTYKPYTYTSIGWKKLGSETVTVSHNDDGSKKVPLSAEWHSGFTSDYTPSSLSLSEEVTLKTIPRATQPSIGAVTLGNAVTISLPRASSSFTHTLTYAFKDASGTIATGAGKSYSWTPSLDLANQIPNASSGTGTITCKTYSGSTLIGTKSVSFTATVPNNSSTNPTDKITLTPVHTLSSAFNGLYIQGKSKLKITHTASGKHGATISTYKAKVTDGKTYTGSSVTSGVLTITGTRTLKYYVTDSRGFQSTTGSTTFNVLPYKPPAVVPKSETTTVLCRRSDSAGNASDKGTYLYIRARKSFSSVSGKNKCSLQMRYKEDGGTYGSWTTLLGTDSSGTEYAGNISGVTLDTTKSYFVQLKAVDLVGTTSAIQEYLIPTATITLHLGKNGTSVGIGGYAYGSGKRLDVAWDTYIDGALRVNNSITAAEDGNPYFHLNDGATDWYLQADKSSAKVAIGPNWDKSTKWDANGNMDVAGNIDGKYVTGTWLKTTEVTDLGRSASKVAVLDSGWVYSRTTSELVSDMKLAPVDLSITYAGGSNFSNTGSTKYGGTAKYFPALGIGVLRVYVNNIVSLTAGSTYNVAKISSNLPGAYNALNVYCGKQVAARINSSGMVQIRPQVAVSAGYDVYIAGMWIAG